MLPGSIAEWKRSSQRLPAATSAVASLAVVRLATTCLAEPSRAVKYLIGMPLAAISLTAVTLAIPARAQAGDPKTDAATLDTRGQVTVNGQPMAYRIRRLPVSSFPELPAAVALALTARGCLIPQSYQAKRPENVIHASFEQAGTQDWAVLCSTQGEVSLLVFFASGLASGTSAMPAVLSKRPELKCLEARNAIGEMGFAWAIDPAGPKQVHDAQAGMTHRLPILDHDCVADSEIDGRTIYHLYRNGNWETVPTE